MNTSLWLPPPITNRYHITHTHHVAVSITSEGLVRG